VSNDKGTSNHYIHLYVCVYIYIHIYIHMYTYAYTYIHMCVCAYQSVRSKRLDVRERDQRARQGETERGIRERDRERQRETNRETEREGEREMV